MGATAVRERTFYGAADFEAKHAAIHYLLQRGFSVGRWQARSPAGILLGHFDIQKWRNLSSDDRAALHGKMYGDGRHGPITVEITSRDRAVIAAFERAA